VPSSAAIIASRANPNSREASVPVDTVRKERIMKPLQMASLAGAGLNVIGRGTPGSKPTWTGFSVPSQLPQQDLIE
jgi:hypothetical protein